MFNKREQVKVVFPRSEQESWVVFYVGANLPVRVALTACMWEGFYWYVPKNVI